MCSKCGNEFNGLCSFCFTKHRKKKAQREKMIDKTIRRANKTKEAEVKKAKTSYREIMEAQEFWMKNI